MTACSYGTMQAYESYGKAINTESAISWRRCIKFVGAIITVSSSGDIYQFRLS